VRNYEEAPSATLTYQKPALFPYGVVRIQNGDGERIAEGSGRLGEINTVFPKIGRGLRTIPYEL